MSRNLPTRAVLAVSVDYLHALPAELGPTLGAIHVATSSILLNALRTIRTLLGLLLNDGKTLVLFLESIFDACLVLFARLVFVPWAIARNARFSATLLTSADIRGARTKDQGWSCGRRRVFLCFDCGADASSDPASPGGSLGIAQFDRILSGAGDALVACGAYVNLAGLTSWSKTPAPTWSVLSDVLALKLYIPERCC